LRALRIIFVAGTVLAAEVAATLALWRNQADRPLPDRTMANIKMAGFTGLGHDRGSKAGFDPSTGGAGYLFDGPSLQTAEIMTSLSGVTVTWRPNLQPLPAGEGFQWGSARWRTSFALPTTPILD
jgi:hypothetical protein